MTTIDPGPASGFRRRLSGDARDRAWWVALSLVVIASGVVSLWVIWSAERSDFYASVALSMSQNPSNWFFGSLDPAGTVTLDKIPGSFWIPALFIAAFGFSTASIVVPNGLATAAAVLLVGLTGRRLGGRTAGIIAACACATTPIVAAVARSNQPQSFFVLTLAAVAYAVSRAISENSRRHLLWAGVWVGVGFNTYMLEAWALWPAIILGYLLTSQPWRRRLGDLLIAGVTSLVVSLAWIVAVTLIPAESRPYIGGSNSNSALEMVFGYNGLGRFGETTASSSYRSFTPPFSGTPSAWRFFTEALAGQIAWLIPVTVVAVVLLVAVRWRYPLLVFLTLWFAIDYAMFSLVAGMHQFYVSAMAVPMAIIIAVAIVEVGRLGWAWAQILLAAVGAVTAFAVSLLYPGYLAIAAYVQAGLAVVTAAVIVIRQLRRAKTTWWVSALVASSLLLTPATWTIDTVNHSNPINPIAGGSGDALAGPQRAGPLAGSIDTAMIDFLKTNRGDARYLVATFGSTVAAAVITRTGGESVLPIGGFDGQDPVPTLETFIALVQGKELRFVLDTEGQGGPGQGRPPAGATPASGMTGGPGFTPGDRPSAGFPGPSGSFGSGGGSGAGRSGPVGQIAAWVKQHCSPDTTLAGYSELYDCSSPKA